ncbi:MAG: ComEC/Rec2 family competence protein, partial [Acidimicrobiia bacterium]|nr:ComEC/Rec2 family competence protein [Acidimicrobiia bacterium]
RLGRVGAQEVVGRLAAVGEIGPLGSANVGYGAANAVRLRVLEGLDRVDRRQALLAGFLIGETSGVPEVDEQALRLAGLSHFVAVSGSNVGLFLVGWWLLLGPLATRPRRRALLGLVGIVLFVLITRAEPSVLRAGTMAGLVLVGRLIGVDLDGWTVLGVTVSTVIVWSGDMATSVAFQLSSAATIGVMLAIRVPLPPGPKVRRWLVGAAVATSFAQATVAPLLVMHFGSIPILAPVANVLAAPLVAVATAIGWPATLLGNGILVEVASAPAGLVLGIAEVAAGWPQAGVLGAGLLGILATAMARPRLRPFAVTGLVLSVVWSTVSIGAPPALPTVVFLDVGQGDATLLLDPSGAVVLVDGGREPAVLAAALRRNGIRHIDLLVVTHGDADHVADSGIWLDGYRSTSCGTPGSKTLAS